MKCRGAQPKAFATSVRDCVSLAATKFSWIFTEGAGSATLAFSFKFSAAKRSVYVVEAGLDGRVLLLRERV